MMMRTLTRTVCGLMLLAVVSVAANCSTTEPGVKSSFHTQWTTVTGDPVKVTNAAKQVLEDLQLDRIEAKSTGVDGVASAFTAKNTKVSIDVKLATDTTSEISVSVGTLGDPELGKDILSRVQKKLAT